MAYHYKKAEAKKYLDYAISLTKLYGEKNGRMQEQKIIDKFGISRASARTFHAKALRLGRHPKKGWLKK